MCRVWTFVGTCIRVEYTYRSYAGMMSGVACDQDDFVFGRGEQNSDAGWEDFARKRGDDGYADRLGGFVAEVG